MKHYGDITKINGAKVEAVDIITGGSPCQDLSVAGNRAGLNGERSGLFMEQVRIVKEMREHDRQVRFNGRADVPVRPRYMVWENVKGALSSPGKKNGIDRRGEDFQAVLTECVRVVRPDAPDVPLPDGRKWGGAGCIYGVGTDGQPFSVAWRLHDAQYFGVAQRRERLCVLCDFDGNTAAEILFDLQFWKDPLCASAEEIERNLRRRYDAGRTDETDPVAESVFGHPDAGETAREGTAGPAEDSVGTAISFQERAGCAGGGKGILIQDDRTGALSTLNNQSVCYGISPYASNAMMSDNPHSGIYEADTARTLDNNGGSPACNQGGVAIVEPLLLESNQNHATVQEDGVSTALPAAMGEGGGYIPMICMEGNGSRESHKCDGYAESETMYTLNSTEQHAVCAGFKAGNGPHAHGIGYEEEMSPTVASSPSGLNTAPTVFDARGNGDGQTAPTITGDHQNRVTDYTAVCIGNGQADQLKPSEQVGALNCMHDQQAVLSYQEVTGPLCPGAHPGGCNGQDAYNDMCVVHALKGKANCQYREDSETYPMTHGIVRRLSCKECERLQGYPDGWTDIGDWVDSKGKKHKAAWSPRYKALGNSIALPFWAWLARRITAQYERSDVTMASLFDGIGGFPLVFSRAGCRPVWASEIEEFAIAVTKVRWDI